VVSKGLLFCWQIILARMLGAHGYGLYGTIGALLAVGAVIPDLGMGIIVIRDVASDPRQTDRYLAATMILQPALALAGYVVLIAISIVGYETELTVLLAIAAFGLLVDVFGNLAHNQMVAAEQMLVPSLINIGHVSLAIVFGWTALKAGGGMGGLYGALLTAGIIRSVVYMALLKKQGRHPGFSLDGDLVRRLLSAGAPLAAAAFLTMATSHIDKLLTTALTNPSNTGYLTAGYIVVFGMQELVSTPWLVATLPLMARMHTEGETTRVHGLAAALLSLSLATGLPLAIGISSLAEPLATWIYGSAFVATSDVLPLLAWLGVAAMANSVIAQVLTVQDRQLTIMKVRGVCLAANALLTVSLLPGLGVRGAALAALCAEAITLLLMASSASLTRGFWDAIGDRLWRLAIAAAAMAAALRWTMPQGELTAVAIGAFAYAASALAVGVIRPDDVQLIRRLVEGFREAPPAWRAGVPAGVE
jgi:O-antigen/teichoic acid export membrane protein